MMIENLESKIRDRIAQIDAVANLLPGVIIIHRMPGFSLEYMSPNGLAQLGISLAVFRNYTLLEYTEKYFNLEDAEDYAPKLHAMIDNNTDENVTFFQQVKINGSQDWTWHMSIVKILLRDDEGLPLLVINMAYKVDPMQHITKKVDRILKENDFLRKNLNRFSKLTKQECVVLKLLALGSSSAETAEKLFITEGTVETHRKNIRKKLDTSAYFELCEYARAFDLI
ncbi:helix-turn-helix transcriptional regulator [Mucilaginibacter dorajii]|uniref:HTH luxR-type domain-containing protein n=1 Tax=Mucilaginibacter dorajii TaxID=692994 RepID=A0ABP7P0E7_9SPHI|nr:helix-turn-helix transcriptional regulator [Mucilaginibacter dorajii]MCS3735602.1 DNA-binding CsgD family transcriptional regulator [Mucilaginibacter dorajii]